MAPFDYCSTARQIAEYEKRRPKKYRNSGWRYCGVGYYRGSKYGKLLPETGYMYYTTQAWRVLQRCWLGYKIAKGQDDVRKLRYYAEGIRKAQKELGLKIESFPNLRLYGTHEDGGHQLMTDDIEEEPPHNYESQAQRKWREHINASYHT
jgi:hypothetical protein